MNKNLFSPVLQFLVSDQLYEVYYYIKYIIIILKYNNHHHFQFLIYLLHYILGLEQGSITPILIKKLFHSCKSSAKQGEIRMHNHPIQMQCGIKLCCKYKRYKKHDSKESSREFLFKETLSACGFHLINFGSKIK